MDRKEEDLEDNSAADTTASSTTKTRRIDSANALMLAKDAEDAYEKAAKKISISTMYYNVPCPRCGRKTIGNGQKEDVSRLCKGCYLKFNMKDWIKLLFRGRTPLYYYVKQGIYKHIIPAICAKTKKDIEENTSMNNSMNNSMNSSMDISEISNISEVPTNISASLSEISQIEQLKEQKEEIGYKNNSEQEKRVALDIKNPNIQKISTINSNISIEEIKKQSMALEGLESIIKHARKEPNTIGVFLLYLKENVLCPAAKQLNKEYLENKDVSIYTQFYESIKDRYYFLMNSFIFSISQCVNIREISKEDDDNNTTNTENTTSATNNTSVNIDLSGLESTRKEEYLKRVSRALIQDVHNIQQEIQQLQLQNINMQRELDNLKEPNNLQKEIDNTNTQAEQLEKSD